MTRESTLILLGALVIISPFVGLPLAVLSFVLPILGLLIVLIGITLRALAGRAPEQPPAVNESQESEPA